MIRPRCAAFIAGRFAWTSEIAAPICRFASAVRSVGIGILERLFADRSGAVHDGGRGRLGSDLQGGRPGRIGIRKIDQDRAKARGAQRAGRRARLMTS